MAVENKKIVQLVISGVVAVLLVQFYLKAKEQNIEMGFGLVPVLVAARDIPPGGKISDDMVETKGIAVQFVEPGAFLEKVPGQSIHRVLGKVSLAAIPEGSQITQANLREPSALETGIAPMLPPGSRGFVLRLGNLDVAKLILPGDRIDILATFTTRVKGSDDTSKTTYTILQNIMVVAVDKDIIESGRDVTGKKETSEGRLLTLALDPVQSEQLAQAQIESQGEISVIVRAHGDDEIRKLSGVSSNNLLQGSNQPPAAAAPH